MTWGRASMTWRESVNDVKGERQWREGRASMTWRERRQWREGRASMTWRESVNDVKGERQWRGGRASMTWRESVNDVGSRHAPSVRPRDGCLPGDFSLQFYERPASLNIFDTHTWNKWPAMDYGRRGHVMKGSTNIDDIQETREK